MSTQQIPRQPLLRPGARSTLIAGAGALAALALALAIAIAVPDPSVSLIFAVAFAPLAVVALVLNSRLELGVLVLAVYLGLLDGPVKLGTGAHEEATVFRDVLIAAVSVGALLRLLVKKRSFSLPPLSGWVILFVALVLAETFNPNTHGLVKALGGYRQQLEFVPFFFFGYAVMRTKARLRKMFIVLGVIALANGIVSTYQTKIGLGQLAAWGPGYRELVFGEGGVTARAYVHEGVAHIRPPGLGKDAGFGGSVGLITVPCLLALLATTGKRKRLTALLLCLGAMLAVITGLGRLQVVGAVLAVIAFAVLSASAGRRVTRPLLAVLGVIALAIPLGAVLVSIESPGTFSRYSEIAPENITSAKDKKGSELSHLPHQLSVEPFGVGLSTAGAAAGFGGKQAEELEGHQVGSDTQYNFLGDEVGLPGILLWTGLLLTMVGLAVQRLRFIADVELRIDLAAIFAIPISFFIIGASGPVSSSSAGGPFYWLAAGIASYWFLGPGRREAARRVVPELGAVPVPA